MSAQRFNSTGDEQNLMKSLLLEPQKVFIKTEIEQRPPKSTLLERMKYRKHQVSQKKSWFIPITQRDHKVWDEEREIGGGGGVAKWNLTPEITTQAAQPGSWSWREVSALSVPRGKSREERLHTADVRGANSACLPRRGSRWRARLEWEEIPADGPGRGGRLRLGAAAVSRRGGLPNCDDREVSSGSGDGPDCAMCGVFPA